MEQIWTDLLNQLPNIIGVVAVAFFGYLSTLIKKHIKNADVFNALEQFAEDGIVLAEKSGVIKDLTGNEKFSLAVDYVKNALASKGITSVTEDQIKAQVETAFVNGKKNLEDAYAKSSESALEAKTAEAQAQASQAQAALAQAQIQVDTSKAEAENAKATLANIISAAGATTSAAPASTPTPTAVPASETAK